MEVNKGTGSHKNLVKKIMENIDGDEENEKVNFKRYNIFKIMKLKHYRNRIWSAYLKYLTYFITFTLSSAYYLTF